MRKEFNIGDTVKIKYTDTTGVIIDKHLDNKQGEYTVLKDKTNSETKTTKIGKFNSEELIPI